MLNDKNRWPLCTYSLFNYRLPEKMPQFRVRLLTAEGSAEGPVDPWGLLPLDFFRVISILERIFLVNDDVAIRDQWCGIVMHQLNTAPWRGRDEVRAAIRPPVTEHFTALELYLVEVHYTLCDPHDRSSVLSAELVHRYDPQDLSSLMGPPEWHIVAPKSNEAVS